VKHNLHLVTRPESARPHLDGEQGPSRFVAEICFELCQELGTHLENRASSDSQALPLQAAITPVSQRYAEREGVALDGQHQPDVSPQTPVWQHKRVQHAVFGAGKVLGEDQISFEVQFDQGDTLNFSKKSAHLYFSLPDIPADE